MKKLLSLLFGILLIGLLIFGGSPYYRVYQLKKAYDNHDGQTLVKQIDFNQLRPNIEQQLKQSFAQTLALYPMLAKLGGAPLTVAADEFIQQSVNEAVTADNISQLITTQGQVNEATKELAAAWAIASNKVDLQRLIQDMIAQRGDVNAVIKNQMQLMMLKQADELKSHVETGEDSAKPDLAYCGINCFTMSGEVKGYPVTLVLQREGLVDWKIINVVLP